MIWQIIPLNTVAEVYSSCPLGSSVTIGWWWSASPLPHTLERQLVDGKSLKIESKLQRRKVHYKNLRLPSFYREIPKSRFLSFQTKVGFLWKLPVQQVYTFSKIKMICLAVIVSKIILLVQPINYITNWMHHADKVSCFSPTIGLHYWHKIRKYKKNQVGDDILQNKSFISI